MNVPERDGVPEITPLLDNARPADSEPGAMDQEYGAAPPLAVRVAAYAVPDMPAGRLVVVIESGGWTTRCRGLLVATTGVVSESAAEMLKLNVPLCVGVPTSVPVELKVRPTGRAPEAKLHV